MVIQKCQNLIKLYWYCQIYIFAIKNRFKDLNPKLERFDFQSYRLNPSHLQCHQKCISLGLLQNNHVQEDGNLPSLTCKTHFCCKHAFKFANVLNRIHELVEMPFSAAVEYLFLCMPLLSVLLFSAERN